MAFSLDHFAQSIKPWNLPIFRNSDRWLIPCILLHSFFALMYEIGFKSLKYRFWTVSSLMNGHHAVRLMRTPWTTVIATVYVISCVYFVQWSDIACIIGVLSGFYYKSKLECTPLPPKIVQYLMKHPHRWVEPEIPLANGSLPPQVIFVLPILDTLFLILHHWMHVSEGK